MRSECEEDILKLIRPKMEEKESILSLAEKLVAFVDESGTAKGMIVGSVARNTWVSGDLDLDIFMLFDPNLSREELEEKGLLLAKKTALSFGGDIVEKYAEHPYINTNIDGFDVDLVPCYAVPDASQIKSAVDRTPFHTKYISERVKGLSDDVILLKQFLKSCGVYGSDLMTGGFSGYLCELLVCFYGGFHECLEAARGWHPGIVIDIENHQSKEFDDPLVVIDPVDPKRNVAAALCATAMYSFAEYSRGYLSGPSCLFFENRKVRKISYESFSEEIEKRGTFFYGVVFDTPGEIPDIVVPQLKRSVSSAKGLLERNGFSVNRADCFMGEKKSLLLFELLVEKLPRIERRTGPPVWEEENSMRFIQKHLGNAFSGPYICEGVYYAEVERRYTDAGGLLESGDFISCGLGKHVKRVISGNYSVFKGSECWNEEFSGFLYDFIAKSSPLCRMHILKEL
ncbi:tRNA nucleotidyltransferase (CCA-adding enzyme) [Methanomicrobium sp. W14]|uniref:CCA tRNA nucleotidyltransferase n=1 Tax=Methanomicrobium sp. W14 TaxID=2817839 RepID=UPI001AE85482|nr:CCA tRNA nucleotidyltransferase [Methanomicrobium sp. W14]MBP2132517.1 tRNA nucleotidyltransferase (CCA-adding enzyme) [Methanomicrobium sp. W14]